MFDLMFREDRPAPKNLSRRQALELLSAAGAAFAAGCGSATTSPTAATTATSTTVTPPATSTCAVTAEETAGPYPDRTGMINNSAFFRQDVTESRPGLPVTLVLTIVNVKTGCGPVANANVEIWQCDASGNYSEYAQPGFNGVGQTFLRGVQTTDSSGKVTFKTIYPGWYSGRATHIHVQVFVNGTAVKTTQIAFPEDVSAAVYGTGVYASKGQSPTSNARDNVFSDGVQDEMATVAGDTTIGYTATLTIGVSV
jgi:protocatechuate 3,4-dioxygenase beta subunit